jgi:hypothetical protein
MPKRSRTIANTTRKDNNGVLATAACFLGLQTHKIGNLRGEALVAEAMLLLVRELSNSDETAAVLSLSNVDNELVLGLNRGVSRTVCGWIGVDNRRGRME